MNPMSSRTTAELQAIVAAPEGQYTDAARAAAASELASRPLKEVPVEQPAPPHARTNLRSLLALPLVWIGWGCVVAALSLLPSFQLIFALIVTAIGGLLIWIASRIAPSWPGQLIAIAAIFGIVDVGRGALASPRDVGFLFAGFVSLLCAAGIAVARRTARPK